MKNAIPNFIKSCLLVVSAISLNLNIISVAPRLSAQETKAASVKSSQAIRPPNVVLIFIDDMGYGDIGPFGVEGIPTPNLDQMANEGRRFTDFSVSSAVCSASRAALLTGCFHRRIGISGALFPKSQIGLNPKETTIAESLKSVGYATACYGKWHLGHHPKFLPTNHGFDEYYGLPYSNDMWPIPSGMHVIPGESKKRRGYPGLPLLEGTRVIDPNVDAADQRQLTTNYTERAVQFIKQHADEPFFVYLPHSMVHVPLYVSDKFSGKSSRGIFGDVVMEIDWSVGKITKTIDRLGLSENTLIIFTTDNGPWLNFGDHAGTAGGLREGKGTSWEGGVRVPTLMQWKNKIPAGTTCDVMAGTVDLLPTIVDIASAELPSKKIDGKSILHLLTGEGEQISVRKTTPIYYSGGVLEAVRNERFKLVLPHRYRTLNGKPPGKDGLSVRYEYVDAPMALFDLDLDVGEQIDVSAEHPEIVTELLAAAEKWRTILGDSKTKMKGSEVRSAGVLTKSDERLVW